MTLSEIYFNEIAGQIIGLSAFVGVLVGGLGGLVLAMYKLITNTPLEKDPIFPDEDPLFMNIIGLIGIPILGGIVGMVALPLIAISSPLSLPYGIIILFRKIKLSNG